MIIVFPKDLWAQKYGMTGPLTYVLKWKFESKWLRFHNLPNSKRYPDTKLEEKIIIDRHLRIIKELFPSVENLLVSYMTRTFTENCGQDCSSVSHFKYLKDIDTDDGGDNSWVHFNIAPYKSSEISRLLIMTANDEMKNMMIFDSKLEKLFCPYDGGVDLIIEDNSLISDLRQKYAEWLSKHPKGL